MVTATLTSEWQFDFESWYRSRPGNRDAAMTKTREPGTALYADPRIAELYFAYLRAVESTADELLELKRKLDWHERALDAVGKLVNETITVAKAALPPVEGEAVPE